jgi:N-glycosylase/DNA lyase
MDDETVQLSCSEEDYEQIWEDYFDLKYDYGRIIEKLKNGDDEFLRQAALFGKGIRILQQESFETVISFIISQNKNIPAIKSCIEGICRRYGEKRISREFGNLEYTVFPTPNVLAAAVKEDLRALKTGYRDEYIIHAASAAANGSMDLNRLRNCGYPEAVSSLKSIKGIGEKVANCIALYGLHHIEGFPVDVWINRVFNEIYNGSFPKEKYSGYGGIIQQYMFYYMRYLKGSI